MVGTSQVWAQSQLKLESSKETSVKAPLKKQSPNTSKKFDNSFGYQFRQYQSSGKRFFREGADSSQSEWTLGFRTHPGVRGGGFDFENTYQDVEQVNYFKPSEVYYKFTPTDSTRLYLGRKLMPWSHSDRLWKRGLYESRFMDDPLSSRPAGLTGFFVTSSKPEKKGWMFFASPIYIPELGPRVSVQEGKLVSSNPWFRPPSSVIRLDGNDVEMRYTIDKPDTEEVVLHPSVGGIWSWKDEKEVWGLKASYSYKPMNQLLMSVPFVLNLDDDSDAIELQATVKPLVQYHHLSSITVERSIYPRWSVWADWTYERPEIESVDRKSISQTWEKAHLYTLTLERQPRSVSSRFATQYWLSFSKLIGGDADDRGEFATSGESLFERRFQFHEAVQLGLKTNLGRLIKTPVLWKLSATYDEKQKGGLLSAQLDFFSGDNFHWMLSADWIGKLENTSEIDNGFTGQYRANDRYSLGASYVF